MDAAGAEVGGAAEAWNCACPRTTEGFPHIAQDSVRIRHKNIARNGIERRGIQPCRWCAAQQEGPINRHLARGRARDSKSIGNLMKGVGVVANVYNVALIVVKRGGTGLRV